MTSTPTTSIPTVLTSSTWRERVEDKLNEIETRMKKTTPGQWVNGDYDVRVFYMDANGLTGEANCFACRDNVQLSKRDVQPASTVTRGAVRHVHFKPGTGTLSSAETQSKLFDIDSHGCNSDECQCYVLADEDDVDFIANAKNDIAFLIAELGSVLDELESAQKKGS